MGPSDCQGGVSDTIQDQASSFPEPYSVSSLSSGSERAEALTNAVVDMLQKGAIEPVQTCSLAFTVDYS